MSPTALIRATKRIVAVCGVSLACFCVGCSSDDSGSDSTEYAHEKIAVVVAHSVEDGRAVYDCTGNIRVVVENGVPSRRSRGSCSGYDSVSADAFRAGDTLIFKFNYDRVEYAGSWNTYYATAVEGVSADCFNLLPAQVEPTPPGGTNTNNGGCTTCDWFR